MKIPRTIYILGLIVVGFLSVLLIAFVNYQIISSWFGKDGPANIGSIEVSYVSMGRFLGDFGLPFPGGTSWAPFWYLGFPFHLFYTPLLPALEALLHTLQGMPLWESYRFITGVAYILVPVSVFFLGWQLSGRFAGGLLSGILYSVGPTVFYFLAPEVAVDKFSADFWDPRRFTILVRWGEGPHTLSLVFLPLVGVFFARYLAHRRFLDLLAGSVFLGLTGLSNALGMFAALLLVLSMAFVKHAQASSREKWRAVGDTILIVFLGVGLISFWYNLSFIPNFFGEGGDTGARLLSIFPWGWIGGLLAASVLYYLFGHLIRDFGISVSTLWFLIFFSVVGTYYLSAPPEESFRRIELLPQALRYTTEVDLSLSLLIGVVFGWIVRVLGKKLWAIEVVGTMIGVVLAFVLIIYSQPFWPTAAKAAGLVVDLEKTREAEIAKWLDGHIDEEKGERVFLPGNYGFYLNWWTNVWQHRGGLFQAATHPWVDHIHYQMAVGEDAQISDAWLRVINAKYAVVTTGASPELYKEMKNLARFEEYPVALEERGDIIYEVPLVRPSPAKPVNVGRLSTLRTPKKADDKVPLLTYAGWVERSSTNQTSFEMIGNDTYKIRGTVGNGEAILVQMTADSAWSASHNAGGKLERIKTGKDPLGFLVLYPEPGQARLAEDGESRQVDITLTHGTSWLQWLGYLTTVVTIGGMGWYMIAGRK